MYNHNTLVSSYVVQRSSDVSRCQYIVGVAQMKTDQSLLRSSNLSLTFTTLKCTPCVCVNGLNVRESKADTKAFFMRWPVF